MAEPEIKEEAVETPSEEVAETPAEEPEPVTEEETPDWRKQFVENRKLENPDKALKQLNRYASPEALAEAHLALMNRINQGDFVRRFPKDGDEKEVTKWRSEMGVPEKSDGYELALKNGVVPGEEDQEMINAFKEVAHASNMTPEQLNSAVSWYYDTREQEVQARHDADEAVREEIEDKLRLEWGPDFRKNKAIIEAYLDTGPEGTKDKLLGARLADGTPLASDLDVLRFLADKGREYNPAITLVPGEGASQIQSIDDELTELKRFSAAPKESREWKKYWREGGESRYRELLDAKNKLAARQK